MEYGITLAMYSVTQFFGTFMIGILSDSIGRKVSFQYFYILFITPSRQLQLLLLLES